MKLTIVYTNPSIYLEESNRGIVYVLSPLTNTLAVIQFSLSSELESQLCYPLWPLFTTYSTTSIPGAPSTWLTFRRIATWIPVCQRLLLQDLRCRICHAQLLCRPYRSSNTDDCNQVNRTRPSLTFHVSTCTRYALSSCMSRSRTNISKFRNIEQLT